MNLSRPFHTEETISRLRVLYEEKGLSARQCGEIMGISRNAVIGLAYRNLMHKPDVPDHYPACYWPRRPKRQPRLPKAPKPPVVTVSEHPVTFWERAAHQCIWPLGGPTEPAKFFCGNDKLSQYPYCEWHCRLSYNWRHR